MGIDNLHVQTRQGNVKFVDVAKGKTKINTINVLSEERDLEALRFNRVEGITGRNSGRGDWFHQYSASYLRNIVLFWFCFVYYLLHNICTGMTTQACIHTGCEGETLFQSQEQVASAPGYIWLALTAQVILPLLLRCTQKKPRNGQILSTLSNFLSTFPQPLCKFSIL